MEKTNKPIENLVLRLNKKISNFTFKFDDRLDHFNLQIEKDYLIKFAKNDGGNQLISNNDWLILKHANHKLHEPGLIGIILLMKEKDVKLDKFLEIGSHYGYFSTIIAIIFNQIFLTGIEINNNSIEVAKKNIAINNLQSRVNFELAAISNKSSKDKFIINGFDLIKFDVFKYLKFFLKNILFLNFLQNYNIFPSVAKINSYILSDYCEKKNFYPDIIKIDVEGFQSYIIPYALEYINEHMPIIILEFDDTKTMQKFNRTNSELALIIMDKGYELIWGNHRIKNGNFCHLKRDYLDEINLEENSLGLFIPSKVIDDFI